MIATCLAFVLQSSKPNVIKTLEARAGGVQPAIQLLGVSQAMYYDYRSGRREIPTYIHHSIQAHLALSNRAFRDRQRAILE